MSAPATTYEITIDYGHPTWNKRLTHTAQEFADLIGEIVGLPIPAEEMIDRIWQDVFEANLGGDQVSVVRIKPAKGRVAA